MNHQRLSSPTSFTTRNKPYSLLGLAVVVLSLVAAIFPTRGITRTNAFAVRYSNSNFFSRRVDTPEKSYRQHHSECNQQSYRYYSFSALFLSPSSKDLNVADATHPDTGTNTTVSEVLSTDFGTASKKEERRQYDSELEEAFAKQTRESNPLLGVKSIGVDYGLVRTGVAVTIGYNPEALDVIVTDHPLLAEYEAEKMSEEDVQKEEERRLEIQRSKVTERVVELALRENADRIVVGLPLHKNGTEAPQTALARKFACDHLALSVLKTLGPDVSVYMCDERYTSKEAAARMRSSRSQSKRGNTDNLYGLLDTESAKIILEQHYDDHLQRYTSRRGNDVNDNGIDPTYNGERVTIQDAELVKDLTLEFKERQRRERERLVNERTDREARAQWRKIAMEKERMRSEEQRKIDAANGITKPKKKKKKRKRK
eukprot:jgi/Psemu1/314841/fgenesh1_kg.1727_\